MQRCGGTANLAAGSKIWSKGRFELTIFHEQLWGLGWSILVGNHSVHRHKLWQFDTRFMIIATSVDDGVYM